MMKKNWTLGFLGLLCIPGIVGIFKGNVIEALWIVWIIWFGYFIPEKKTGSKTVVSTEAEKPSDHSNV
jgi:hypothetical protein